VWDYIIYSIFFVVGTLLADYLCSLVFESSRKAGQVLFEIILFLIISNYLLLNTIVSQNSFILAFVYLFFSFISMIFSRVIGFLIFDRALSKIGFVKNENSKNAIKLANQLMDKFSKREVINYFNLSGFSKDLLDHLEKVLKE
jgi:sugar phosphate permease